LSKASIESLVEQKVSEILAQRALNAPDPVPTKNVSEEVQRRLDTIEKRLEGQDGERAEGLSYLFMAKQHQARGEDFSALKMYEIAQPYFPDNEKLRGKIERIRERLSKKREDVAAEPVEQLIEQQPEEDKEVEDEAAPDQQDQSYHDEGQESDYRDPEDDDQSFQRSRPRKQKSKRKPRASSPDPLTFGDPASVTPRTRYLLDVINTRDVLKIKGLNGLGAKRAEGIVDFLDTQVDTREDFELRCWSDLTKLKGVGKKTLETMREGVLV
jgi:hypothetical protein